MAEPTDEEVKRLREIAEDIYLADEDSAAARHLRSGEVTLAPKPEPEPQRYTAHRSPVDGNAWFVSEDGHRRYALFYGIVPDAQQRAEALCAELNGENPTPTPGDAFHNYELRQDNSALEARVKELEAELVAFRQECDAVGIPHDVEVLVRHHRGNAKLIGAAEEHINTIRERDRAEEAEREHSGCEDLIATLSGHWGEEREQAERAIRIVQQAAGINPSAHPGESEFEEACEVLAERGLLPTEGLVPAQVRSDEAQPRPRYADARRIYDDVKRDGQRVLTLPEIQRVIDAHAQARSQEAQPTEGPLFTARAEQVGMERMLPIPYVAVDVEVGEVFDVYRSGSRPAPRKVTAEDVEEAWRLARPLPTEEEDFFPHVADALNAILASKAGA